LICATVGVAGGGVTVDFGGEAAVGFCDGVAVGSCRGVAVGFGPAIGERGEPVAGGAAGDDFLGLGRGERAAAAISGSAAGGFSEDLSGPLVEAWAADLVLPPPAGFPAASSGASAEGCWARIS
jgi:hypothetical protein